jgi:hypothetical protein
MTGMKRLVAFVIPLTALALVPLARSGHELPVYPSYYPHEIEIRTAAPEPAGEALRDGRLHAYVGEGLRFPGAVPDAIRTVDSLGSFVIVRLNAQSPRIQASACAIRDRVLRTIAFNPVDVIFHPYPVTPLHGDYLHHVDLAEAARAQLLAAPGDPAGANEPLRIKAAGTTERLVPSDRRALDSDWDAELLEVRAADLIAPAASALNGWHGPEWLKAGWFHALLLGPPRDDTQRELDSEIDRLRARNHDEPADRVNAERDIVRALIADCRHAVAGYTMKREYYNAEFSAGIENIAFDSIHGFNSPMFMRTVKLKDFPWNGWLNLATPAQPAAAWNPMAGFTDDFGRLMWSAVGDPAALPAPYDSAWILNRITDVEATPRR